MRLTRRAFVTGAVTAAAAAIVVGSPRAISGRLTTREWHAWFDRGVWVDVYLDGVDVVRGGDTVEADDRKGYIERYARKNGKLFGDPATRKIARERLYGTVRYVPRRVTLADRARHRTPS